MHKNNKIVYQNRTNFIKIVPILQNSYQKSYPKSYQKTKTTNHRHNNKRHIFFDTLKAGSGPRDSRGFRHAWFLFFGTILILVRFWNENRTIGKKIVPHRTKKIVPWAKKIVPHLRKSYHT